VLELKQMWKKEISLGFSVNSQLSVTPVGLSELWIYQCRG